MGVRFEVWSHPSTGSFVRRILRLPVEACSFTGRNTGADGGRLLLPPRYPYLSALLVRDPVSPANDRRSVVRIFDDDFSPNIPAAEMVPTAVPDAINPAASTQVTCEGVLRNFTRGAFVWAFDHPVFNQPDWIWGGANILSNPSFEDTLVKPEKYTLGFDATGGTFQMTVDGDTANIPIPTTAAALRAALVALSTVTTVEVSGAGTLLDEFTISFSDPADPFVTVNGGGLTGGGFVFAITDGGLLTPASWEPSRNPVNNLQHGGYTFWGLVSVPAAYDGTYSLAFNGLDLSSWDYPGVQQIKAITPGLYQAVARVNPASASDPYAFVIRDMFEGLVDNLAGTGARVEQTSAAGSWTDAVLADVVIKPGMEAAIIRVGYTGGGNPGEIRVDLVELRPGMAPATLGEILRLLFEDAQVNHAADSPARVALQFIDISGFNDSLDTSGVPWDRLLSVTIPRGWTYWQVLEMFHEEFGYEFGLVTGLTPGTWALQAWNPGGRGVQDPLLNPAVIVGLNAVSAGPLSFEAVVGNAILAEGADRLWSRSESAASIAGAGRIERYVPLGNVLEQATLDAAAAAQLAEQLAQGLAIQLVMPPGAFPLLGRDLPLGARSYVTIPGYLNRYPVRLDAVTMDWRRGEGVPTRTGHFSQEFYEGQVAVNEMVRRLAERAAVLNPPTVKPTSQMAGTGNGGVSHIFSLPGQAFVEQGRLRIYFPYGGTLAWAFAASHVAPTGAPIIVDVNVSGTTIYANQADRPTIPIGANASQIAVVGAVVPQGGYVTVDVDQVGSLLPGGDVTIFVNAAGGVLV